MSKLWKWLSGGVVKQVGDVVDNLVTTEEEKLDAKAKIETILLEAEANVQEQVTRRWEADTATDSWLPKNIRPLTLIFLTVMFVIISMFDGNIGTFEVNVAYVDIYQSLLITVYGAYFVGRTWEKTRK